MGSSEYLGRTRTHPEFTMVSLGAFPQIHRGGIQAVKGELYRVTRDTLRRLDRFEGVPHLYRRELVTLACGKEAWLFLRDEARGQQVVPAGDWRAWVASRD